MNPFASNATAVGPMSVMGGVETVLMDVVWIEIRRTLFEPSSTNARSPVNGSIARSPGYASIAAEAIPPSPAETQFVGPWPAKVEIIPLLEINRMTQFT